MLTITISLANWLKLMKEAKTCKANNVQLQCFGLGNTERQTYVSSSNINLDELFNV